MSLEGAKRYHEIIKHQRDIPDSDVFIKRIGGWLDGQRKLRQKKEKVIIMIMLMVIRKPLLWGVLLSILHYKHFLHWKRTFSQLLLSSNNSEATT